MRKTFKKALSALLSAAMVLTLGSGVDVKNAAAEEATYPAHLAFADASWGHGVWNAGEAKDAKVELKEGSATYTVGATTETESDGAVVFCVDIDGFDKAAKDAGYGIKLGDVSLKLDDKDVAIDATKLQSGDIEEKGNYRIEIYNEYGKTKENGSAVDLAALKWSKSLDVTFTIDLEKGAAVDTPVTSDDPVIAPAPAGESTEAYMTFADTSWANSYWNDGAETKVEATKATVTGEGQYTVGLDFSATDEGEIPGIQFVDVEVKNGEKLFPWYTMKIDSLKINGEAVELTKGYTCSDNGTETRTNLYNPWVSGTADALEAGAYARSYDKVLSDATAQLFDVAQYDAVKTIEVTFTYAKGEAPVVNEPEAEPTAAPAKSYNAYLGFQTSSWDYRDEWEKDANSKDYDFNTQAMIAGEATDVNSVKIENAQITGNGTYTVSIDGVDLSGADEFYMLYVSTDIPAAMKDVKFTDMKVTIDGKEVATVAEGAIKKEVQEGSKKYYMVMAINGKWGKEGVDVPPAFDYTMPEKSVAIQFTVSGLNLDQDFSTKTFGAKKGATFTSGDFKYKVTKAATITADKTTKGKVEVVGLSAAGKKKASVTVGDTVKYTSNKQKATYTISSVAAGAFKKASKLTAATLGKNIKAIKKNTFQNDKKLATLTLKAKLSKVEKNAFKGCKKTIKVKGTATKANVKKLVKSGYKSFK